MLIEKKNFYTEIEILEKKALKDIKIMSIIIDFGLICTIIVVSLFIEFPFYLFVIVSVYGTFDYFRRIKKLNGVEVFNKKVVDTIYENTKDGTSMIIDRVFTLLSDEYKFENTMLVSGMISSIIVILFIVQFL